MEQILKNIPDIKDKIITIKYEDSDKEFCIIKEDSQLEEACEAILE